MKGLDAFPGTLKLCPSTALPPVPKPDDGTDNTAAGRCDVTRDVRNLAKLRTQGLESS